MSEVPLKEHIEAQIRWLDRHVESQIKLIDIGTVKALAQLDKRLEGMNEFRDSLRDQAARFETKEGSDLKLRPLYDKLEALTQARALLDGKLIVVTSLVAVVASVLVGVLFRWLIKA